MNKRHLVHRSRLLVSALLALWLVAELAIGGLVPPRSVEAAFPGTNGKIAFISDREGNDEIYVMDADGSIPTNLTDHSADDINPVWAPDGSKIAFSSRRDGNDEIYVMNADGSNPTNLTNHPHFERSFAWSPDGSKIAFSTTRDALLEIYVMDADGSNQTRLTNHPAIDGAPSWSPDGSKIAFNSERDGNPEIHVMNADGSNVTRLTNNTATDSSPDWSPDGTKIAFNSNRDGSHDIYVMNADGSNVTRLTNHAESDIGPSWSPDGSQIVFHSTRDGNFEIYVMNANGSGQTNLTNDPANDTFPNWQSIPIPVPDPDSTAQLTVIKHLNNSEEVTGEPSAVLGLCDVQLQVQSLVDAEVHSFSGAQPQVCQEDPQATSGSTTLTLQLGGGSETYVVREPNLDDDYAATFSGDCDFAGRISAQSNEELTCEVTNTFVHPESMANSNALLTVIKRVDNGDNVEGNELGVCDFSIQVRERHTFDLVAEFPAEGAQFCPQPGLVEGTTHLGVKVNTDFHNGPLEGAFLLSESNLDPRYVATYSENCAGGEVTVALGEHVTCTITNTLVDFSEPGANALLTVEKHLDNQEDVRGDGSALDLCEIELQVDRQFGSDLVGVDSFQAAGPPDCQKTTGVTTIGINVDPDLHSGSISETFIVSEPALDPRYLASFGEDCDGAGQVALQRGEHKTCIVTNTLLNEDSMSDSNALLTVIKHVDNGPTTDFNEQSVCEFVLRVERLFGVQPAPAVDFPAEQCNQPDLLVGTTQLGVEVDPGSHDPSDPNTFLVSEPNLPPDYQVTFSGDCDSLGRVEIARREHKTCTVTNTFIGDEDAQQNSPPVVHDDSYATGEDTPLIVDAAVGVLTNDTDAEANPLSAILVTEPANGNLSLATDGSFSYTPDANFNGSDSFTYMADDGNLQSSPATVTITVDPVNDMPLVSVAQATVSVDEGQLATNSVAVSDVDGDSITVTASAGTVIENVDGAWSWSLASIDGPTESQTVTISADDGNGGVSTTTFALTVTNGAPVVGPMTAPPDPVQINTVITAGASFIDPGVLDTHTALFDWGDGSASVGIVTEANGSGSVSGSHAYTVPGVYTITLTVTDKDGGVGQALYEYVVVYDPDGGFVTGGGWITSPAGAYPADPSLTGKASFGFVAKYKKGQSVPDGNTQFQFHAAGMRFHSTSYDWLVIAGAKAKFKGTGTIDGSGNYGFMLSGVDGQVSGGGGTDRFRIKIWDIATGAIVYDNQIGDGDDVELSTVLGGGSIVIHKK